MEYGDSWHSIHQCVIAQNLIIGHGELYALWDAGHRISRLTECRYRQEIWNWTRLRIAITYQRHGYVIRIIVNTQFTHSKKNIWNNIKIFLANFKFCEIVHSKRWLLKENKSGFNKKYFNYFLLNLIYWETEMLTHFLFNHSVNSNPVSKLYCVQ
jgi:hypothetical protein